MQTIVLIVHMLAAIGLISMVLLQQGKGADMGAAFGAGASGTVFGSQGSGSFLTRATVVLAALFFITSLWLAYFSGQGVVRKSVIDEAAQVEMQNTQPVAVDIPSAPGDVPVQSDIPEPK